MKLFGSFHLKARILDLFKSFPMECVTDWCFCSFCISEVPETAIEWNYILYFTPVIFVAVYSANRIFSHANAKWIYYAVLPAMAIIFGLTFYRLGKFIDSAGYPVLLILAAIVFLTHRQPADNSEFSRRLLQRVLNAFFRNGNWIADIAVRCIDCFFNQLYIFLENRQLFGLCGSFHIPLRNSIVVVFAAKGFGI